jgi:hypothetical protein
MVQGVAEIDEKVEAHARGKSGKGLQPTVVLHNT